jgi:hypothetical protein
MLRAMKESGKHHVQLKLNWHLSQTVLLQGSPS